ncbi:MAG: anti-sigma factor domain-containing protein [Clostridia bacterium]|nr:anti-sigma factor domain-containing protein [Clostridia bacterium]
MGLNKGLVTKVKEKYCIVVTKEGEFKRVPLPSQPVRVGQEITFREGGILNNWTKYSLLVASFLLVMVGVNFLYQPEIAPAAYVSLDINPSIELAVDKEQKVIDVKTFNQDGQQLVDSAKVINLDLYEAIEKLIASAIANKYMQPTGKNIILTAVFPAGSEKLKVDEDKIQKVITNNLNQGRLPGEIVIYQVDDNIRKKADALKLTMGKTVILEYAKNSGSQVTAAEIKAASITSLVTEGKIKDPVEYSKAKVKIPVKASILKVDRDKDDDDEDTDDDIHEDKGKINKNNPALPKKDDDHRDKQDDDDRKEDDKKAINNQSNKKGVKPVRPDKKNTEKIKVDDKDDRDDREDDKKDNQNPNTIPNPGVDDKEDDKDNKEKEEQEEDESRPLSDRKGNKQNIGKINDEGNNNQKDETKEKDKDKERDKDKQKDKDKNEEKED